MWKHLGFLSLVICLSVHATVIESINEVALECDPNEYGDEHSNHFECFLIEVKSPNDKVVVTSSSVEPEAVKSQKKTIYVEIVGNANYPEQFPVDLAAKLTGAHNFRYKETPLKFIKREDLKNFGSTLTLLNLAQNEIEDISFDSFFDLTSLSYLDVGYNKLKKLDSRLFSKSPLFDSLFVRGNELTELHPDLLNDCPEFYVLYAEFNKIAEFHEDLLKNNQNMSVISMRHNKIKNIPIDFNKFKGLHVADFTHNAGTCDTMFFERQPYVEYYNDEEQKKWIKTVPEFQQKIEAVCRA